MDECRVCEGACDGYLSFSFEVSAYLQERRNELRGAKDFTEFTYNNLRLCSHL